MQSATQQDQGTPCGLRATGWLLQDGASQIAAAVGSPDNPDAGAREELWRRMWNGHVDRVFRKINAFIADRIHGCWRR